MTDLTDADLLPLPPSMLRGLYGERDMRAYARACITADRARAAAVCGKNCVTGGWCGRRDCPNINAASEQGQHNGETE